MRFLLFFTLFLLSGCGSDERFAGSNGVPTNLPTDVPRPFPTLADPGYRAPTPTATPAPCGNDHEKQHEPD